MPFGYLEFSRAIGRNHARTCARRRWRRRRRPAGAGAGPGSGSGSGLGLGSGSLPGLVLFELGLRVWVSGSEPTRSKTVGIPTVATVGLPTVVTVGCIL